MILYTKICVACGKAFEAKAHNAKYCSLNCRKSATRIKYEPVKNVCQTCGKQLPDGRQQWCIDCLLEDYKKTRSELAYNRLRNRGYDKEMIKEELKNRRK